MVAAAAALLIASPGAAQMLGNDGTAFVDALREGDGNKALGLLRDRPTVINARDAKGDTGLIAAILKRDEDWILYLLQNGANPELTGRNGDTPLIAAARIGNEVAARHLLVRRVKVDGANKMGETALILAVQQRQRKMVELLLAVGANPDKADSAAGLSARDYAKRDSRSGDMLKLIEAMKQPAKSGAAALKL
jgi:ankyrin repeat protein